MSELLVLMKYFELCKPSRSISVNVKSSVMIPCNLPSDMYLQ